MTEALASLLKLPAGWNSYRAKTIDVEQVGLATRVLHFLMRPDFPAPSVVPTVRGGVQLEWHRDGIDFEIETLTPENLRAYFSDEHSGREWESDIGADWAPLRQGLTEIARTRKGRPAAQGS